jgi:hypothetical protein
VTRGAWCVVRGAWCVVRGVRTVCSCAVPPSDVQNTRCAPKEVSSYINKNDAAIDSELPKALVLVLALALALASVSLVGVGRSPRLWVQQPQAPLSNSVDLADVSESLLAKRCVAVYGVYSESCRITKKTEGYRNDYLNANKPNALGPSLTWTSVPTHIETTRRGTTEPRDHVSPISTPALTPPRPGGTNMAQQRRARERDGNLLLLHHARHVKRPTHPYARPTESRYRFLTNPRRRRVEPA